MQRSSRPRANRPRLRFVIFIIDTKRTARIAPGHSLACDRFSLEVQLGFELHLTSGVETVIGTRCSTEGRKRGAGEEGHDATLLRRAGGSADSLAFLRRTGRGARRKESGKAAIHRGDDLVVEQVERICRKLHVDVLVDGNVAGNPEIKIVEARTHDAVASDLRWTACGGAAGA